MATAALTADNIAARHHGARFLDCKRLGRNVLVGVRPVR